MNAPRDLGPDFRSWMRETPAMPPELPTRTLDETRHTRQRRRWLWFLPGPKPTAGAGGRSDRIRPTAPTTTIRFGGTSTMISPAKLVTGAAVAALMGALLLARPFTSQEVSDQASPAGPSDEPIVTLVSGQMSGRFDQDSPGKTEATDWGYSVTDALGTFQLDTSDERLSGPLRMRTDYYARSGYEYGPFAFTVYLENDGGSWDGSGVAYLDPIATEGDPGGAHMQAVLSGQDAYQGMTAILAMDTQGWSSDWAVSGSLQPFQLPPAPEAAPTSFE